MKSNTRPYAMTVRAEAAGATRARILASTNKLLAQHCFEDITLDAIAADANTTVRTVLRGFGSKEMLLSAALESRGDYGHGPLSPGDADATVRTLYDFYETVGDAAIRMLADETRLPAMRAELNKGRRALRLWVAASFEPTLTPLAEAERARTLDALIVALDVYAWKLLRRDFGLGPADAQAVTKKIILALTEGQ